MAGLTLAPSVDQPTVTFASVGSGAAPTIAGSPGWLREKRTGVAEVAAGAAQTSTAALDLTGSTRFRYPGMPSAIGYAANAGQYVTSELKPGASSAAAYWPFNVEFTTSSPTVEIRMNAPVTNPGTGRILVNGLPIVDTTTSIASTATAGGGYAMKLTFGTSASRIITLVALNNTVGRFGGVAVESGYTVVKPTDTVTRIAFIGDSYVNGATVGIVDTFAWRTASILGSGRNVILAGIGGTGYQTLIGADSNSLFVNRVSAVMAMNPDIVLLDGGRNDSSSGQQAAVEAVIDAITALGSPTIYVTNSSSQSSQAAVNTAMQAAATSRSKTWFTSDVDSLPKLGDAVHPTQAGHITLADATAAFMTVSTTYPAAGNVDAVSAASGSVTSRLAAAALVAAVSAATAVITSILPITGTPAAAASTAAAAVTSRLTITGMTTATSAVNGAATVIAGGNYAASGTVAAVTGTVGAVTSRLPVAGTTATATGTSVTVTGRYPTTGTTAATTGAAGAATVISGGGLSVSGTAAAGSGVTASIAARAVVSGTTAGASGTNVAANLRTQVAGVVAVTSTAHASAENPTGHRDTNVTIGDPHGSALRTGNPYRGPLTIGSPRS